MYTGLRSADIIGSGPNGLAAAITLAQAGIAVRLFERMAQPGGACSSGELTLPGFMHDLGASALPMAAASPFLQSLPLAQHGFQFLPPEFPLAHPLDDGSAVALTASLHDMSSQLPAEDASAWQSLFGAIVRGWKELVPELLGPVLHLPRHPLTLARFGLPALLPATALAHRRFSEARAKALFAGCAAHSVMPLEAPLSAAVALVLGGAGHTVGWPVAAGGSQTLANALATHLAALGGTIHLNHAVDDLTELTGDVLLFDTSASSLERIAGPRLAPRFRSTLRSFRLGPGAFKIDWALNQPIPWTAPECRRAGTIHVGGTLEEIAFAEAEIFARRHPRKPFVILVQPSIVDPSRAPVGKHTAWAYCHVPNGSTENCTAAIEAQITRFAPGFPDVVLARRTHSTAQLEAWNANLVGGDLSGGAMTSRQMLLRPSIRDYGTSDPRIFLCSSSTPPGGGVHGMCGYHAARLALRSR